MNKEIKKKYSLGIDIGGTKCAVLLGKSEIPEDYSEDFILERICFATEVEKGHDYTIGKIIEAIEMIIEKYNATTDQFVGVGISCGGPLDHKLGIILHPPNLIGWDNVPIVNIIHERFGIPTFLENDANAGALAEWKFGAAKGRNSVIFLTFGTGLGAGLILNGQLYNGANDMAGEVGHIRLSNFGPIGYGKAGSFEGFCSGGGIAQIARMKIHEQVQLGITPLMVKKVEDIDKIDTKLVAEAATEGDALALEVFKISGEYLGRGLSILIDILNPEIIVIGSIFEKCETLLNESMVEIIKKETLQRSYGACKIVPAQLGNQIGDYAALSVAFQNK